jgi:hypothetical protein
MAEAHGLDELRAHSLATIGMAKRELDDPSSSEDMERALRIALEIDSPTASSVANNMAVAELIAGRTRGVHGAVAPLTRFAVSLGVRDEVRAAVQNSPAPSARRWRDALLLALEDDFRGAADVFSEMGSVTMEAAQRLNAGEDLLEGGRHAEGATELGKAIEFYASVDATYYLHRAQALLADAQSESA